MITKLTLENFKRFGQKVEIELGSPVVFVGPNNCGKTTALQALALWETAVRRWFEKRHPDVTKASERAGVAINRKDILFAPVPDSKIYWHGLHVRRGVKRDGKIATQNIRMKIVVDGIADGNVWACGFEFDYQNAETLLVRPLRKDGYEDTSVAEAEYTVPPEAARRVRIAYLPPMSGLASVEDRLDSGAIRRRIGEGRTAEVLRNLCYSLLHPDNNGGNPDGPLQRWNELKGTVQRLFGVELLEPDYNTVRGEVTMSYRDNGTELDLASSGRGMQQTLLLFSYLYSNPGTTLLLDEPDAHLEVLRQRQTYNLLVDSARKLNSQVIATSHSEVVLNEAAGKDCVVAFVGTKPRLLSKSDRGSQLIKALTTYGFENYVLGETKGWVLYLEGSTDLEILRALAKLINHPALPHLEAPFVHYLNVNLPKSAREHFYGIRQAVPTLRGFALFDRIERPLETEKYYVEAAWSRREIENYFCTQEVLLRFARGDQADTDLFSAADAGRRVALMGKAIEEVEKSLKVLDRPSPWSADSKTSDDFLRPLFKEYFAALNLPNLIAKSDFHQLVPFLLPEEVDGEIRTKLDQLLAIATQVE